jgi:hypothetical protein
MKKKVEQVVGLPVDEYHGVGGEYVLNEQGKRVPLLPVGEGQAQMDQGPAEAFEQFEPVKE